MIASPQWPEGDGGAISAVATRLPRWVEEVPLYRHRLPAGIRWDSPTDFARQFSALPILTKQDIRNGFPRNFLRDGVVIADLLERQLVELEQTSGTSDEPVPLLLAHGWWERQERDALELNPQIHSFLHHAPHSRRITLTSPSCNHDICYKGIPPKSDRILGQALHVNLTRHPFLWSETELERMVEEILNWQPLFMDMDPVYGVCLARFCARHKIVPASLRFIISSYEYLSVVHRRFLEEVFGVPVFNLYGSTETGHVLMETHPGSMAPSTTTAFLELVSPDSQGIGEILVTTLANDYMPLIRYRIGDLARRHPASTRDGYYELHGRTMDALTDTEGARVTVRQVDDHFADLRGIIHYQLLQQATDAWVLRLVTEEDADLPVLLRQILGRLRDRLKTRSGLRIETTDYIACESSGKFRLCRRLGSP
jgi:phenylacetate-CoA ligase